MSTGYQKRRVSELRPHPLQTEVFHDLSEVELRALADDIKANGLRHPIEITPDGVVICGHQRLRAVKLLGWKMIRCVVRRDLADQGREAVERRLVEDNLNRRNLGKLGIVRAAAALMKVVDKDAVKGTTLRDYVAARFNISGRTVDRHLKYLAVPPAIQEAWDRRQLTDSDMSLVLKASEQRRKRIAERIQQGANPKDAVGELASGPVSASTPPVRTCVKHVVRALATLRAALPSSEEQWEPEQWSQAVTQLRSGRKLLRKLCELARVSQA